MPRKTLYWLVILAFINFLGRASALIAEDELKTTFLSLFGFKDVPKIDGKKLKIPETIMKLYQIQTGFRMDTASIPLPGLHTQSANTVRSFTHVESPVDARFSHHHKFRLKFDVSRIPKNEHLKAAELKLMRETQENSHRNHYYQRILVNDILKPGIKGSHGPIMRVIDSKLIDVRKNQTLSLDVSPAVKRWVESPSSNYGLLISIYTVGDKKSKPLRNVRLRRDVNEEDWVAKQPLLFTYTDDGKNKQKTGAQMMTIRTKRGFRRNHRKGDQRDPCRRRPMFVNFSDVGWNDWIVAPLGYDAYYCDGECEYPMAEHMNTTNHAIVQSLMNSARPNDVPKPCCVPTHLSSMSMLYLDSHSNVILKNYKEMVVNGCGCR